MKSFYGSLLIVLLVASCIAAGFSTPAPSDLMKKKTVHAQNILKYLALGDLKNVRSEADSLDRLMAESGFEEKPGRYAEYGREFLKLVKELSAEAGNGNLAGSYYRFTRMTSVCFSCHEHIRDASAGGK